MTEPAKRGPARDVATDRHIEEIAEDLIAVGIIPSHSHIATVLSVERGEYISREAVRSRRRRATREAAQ